MTLPRLWAAFAAVWVVVLVINVAPILREPLGTTRMTATLAGLATLVVIYLWLTLGSGVAGDRLGPFAEPVSGRPLRRRIAAVAAIAVLVVGLVLLTPTTGMWWHIMFAVVGAGLALPITAAAVGIAALVALAMALAWIVTSEVELRLLILFSIGAASVAVRQLAITVTALRAAREELALRAVDEERLRIARDLHDLLGHSLSVVVLKSELAGRLLPTHPDGARAEVRDIEHAARDALAQVRAAVSGYRQPTLRAELAAARELLEASGIGMVVRDTASPLPQALDSLLAWMVREGVTNVVRHSRARECAIHIARDDRSASVTVSDDGTGAPPEAAAHGSGLRGLAERARECGGSLELEPDAGGGLCLRVRAPLAIRTGEAS